MNGHRSKHHNGNEVCDCAKLGGKPCMVNGDVGKKVLDDNGVHIGWTSRAERRKKA